MQRGYIDLYRRVAQKVKLDYAAYDVREDRDCTTKFIDELSFYVMHSVVSDVRFAHIVSKYLACFEDPHLRLHVNHSLSPYKCYDYGVALRRLGDNLYVETSMHPQLRRGDRIVSAEYHSIPELASMSSPSLFGTDAEREAWEDIFHFCNVVSIEREGTVLKNIKLEKGIFLGSPETNEVHIASDGIACVTLRRIESASAIERFVSDHSQALTNARGVIVDLRNCTGQCDEALEFLAPLVATPDMKVADFLESSCLMNYSESNCNLLKELLSPNAGSPWAREILKEVEENRGKGLMPFDCALPDELNRSISPLGENPAVVLTDSRCAGTAETLAEIGKASERCILAGRNSRGSFGTLFPINVAIDERFSLEYPLACFSDDALSRHGSVCGIDVDMHIPWTTDHLSRDVDIEKALSILTSAHYE